MTVLRRRIVSCLLAVLAIVVLTQHRLSDGGIRIVRDDTPELWEQVLHGSAVTATTRVARALDCPLVLSINRKSLYIFTSVDDGVLFDLDADGSRDRVSWPEPASDVAFLAVDRNGDGRITSGKELFGRHTVRGATNGMNALMKLTAESSSGSVRGGINLDDPLFRTLLLWTDANHNGISEAAELRPAHQVLSDIGLGFGRHHRKDRHGNESRSRGFVHVRTAPGINSTSASEDDVVRRRWMYDACLVSRSGRSGR
jgi:hypothetical protein